MDMPGIAQRLLRRGTAQKLFDMLIDDVVRNHHAIAIEGGTDGAGCGQRWREFTCIDSNFVFLKTSPRRT
jgi:hypothetical protein